ncbi:MAG: PIN domain-containing protein [Blastocatellia bacterium]
MSLDDNDLWLAAMAMAIKATLVTRDKDFYSLSGLHSVDWSV